MRHLTFANVVASLALLIAVGTGGAWAASKLITGKQIKDRSITARDIKKGTLGTDRLKPAAVLALKGAKGASGAKGATGTAGVAGKDAISDMKLVSNSLTTSGDKFVSVNCPAGYYATGGSGLTPIENDDLAVTSTSFVGADGQPASGYTAVAKELNAVIDPWKLTVVANCAKIAS